jgi:hypothetical protein
MKMSRFELLCPGHPQANARFACANNSLDCLLLRHRPKPRFIRNGPQA